MARRLAAILAADVVGYSRLMAADERHARAPEGVRKDFLEPKTTEHHGRVVKLTGDGALIEFASVVDAVECAGAIQKGVVERQTELPEGQQIAFRIGINIGDILIEDDDIYGDGVNVAARLEALAEPGGICVSRTVYNHVRNKVAFGFEPMGEHQVKNIPEPVVVYRVLSEPGPIAKVLRLKRAGTPKWRRAAVAAIAVVLLGAGGVAVRLQPWQTPEMPYDVDAPPLPDKPSIAVLPFENLSDDPEEGYFADGLTDDLITDLSKISGLLTIARNSVFIYKDQPIDIREVAKELGARYVLEGSVRRAGDRVRINAQLIDSETGGHLWADRFDRDAADIFAIQDEVTRHIVGALAVELSVSEQQRLQRLPTTDLEAYDYFLRAKQLARTGFRPQLRRKPCSFMRRRRRSIRRSPTHTPPMRGLPPMSGAATSLTSCPGQWRASGPMNMPAPRWSLTPEAPLPFAVLAVLQLVDRRYEEALASAERAVVLGPGDAEAHATLSFVLTFTGRHAEAVAAHEAAMRLNPNLPTSDRQVAGLAFLLNEEPERAIEMLERARAEAPRVDDTYALLAAAYVRVGRSDEARSAVAEARHLFPGINVSIYRITLGYFRSSEDLALILDAMQEAGLPEWPYGFRGDEQDSLSGAEIENLALGRTWLGRLEGVGPALMQIGHDGQEAFRTPTHILTGVAFVDGDMLCEHNEAVSLGRPVCGPVYRQPKRRAGTRPATSMSTPTSCSTSRRSSRAGAS